MKIEENVLIADEGKVLTKDGIYSKQVWLGINDSPSNWQEVDEIESEEIDDIEALEIITGQ